MDYNNLLLEHRKNMYIVLKAVTSILTQIKRI